jgi:hypothetical protein
MATKKYFFPYGSFVIKYGSEIRFWEDKWLGNATLREQYPALYNIVLLKGDTIAKVLEFSPPNEKIFNDKNSSLMQVIYRCIAMLCSWSSLQRVENCDLFMKCLQGWKTLRWIFLYNMDVSVIFGLVLHRRRHLCSFYESYSYCASFIFYLLFDWI